MLKPFRDNPPDKTKSAISRKKMWERLKIRELLAEGKSYPDIRAQLGNISNATFWNRMNEIRMEDNDIIKKKLDENNTFLVTDLTTLDRQLGETIDFCKNLIENEKTSPFLKLETKKFMTDVQVWKFKLQVEGPRVIMEATTPVRKIAMGELKPMEAIQQGLPKLKSATNEERERFGKWAAQVQEEKVIPTGVSQEEKGQDSA
jgi:hypothetical protein